MSAALATLSFMTPHIEGVSERLPTPHVKDVLRRASSDDSHNAASSAERALTRSLRRDDLTEASSQATFLRSQFSNNLVCLLFWGRDNNFTTGMVCFLAIRAHEDDGWLMVVKCMKEVRHCAFVA